MFETLSDRLTSVFSSLRSKGRLSDADIDATCREIRIALLEADVALPVVREFVARVKERARGAEVSQALNPAQQVVKIVHDELIEVLGGETRRLRYAKTPPTVIMLAGLQGSGKTTLAGKLARWLRMQGHAPLLVACDLQRPNAVQQLSVLANGPRWRSSPPSRATASATRSTWPAGRSSTPGSKHHDMVIIDTAGRLGIDQEMMQQAADIRDAVQPDEILFVVDAMIGQDAVTTAQAFMDGVGFDARRAHQARRRRARRRRALGAARHRPADHVRLHRREARGLRRSSTRTGWRRRILDMGDILTLIEQAQRTFDEQEAAKMAGKLVSGEGFTLDDFLEQMMMVRRLGPIKNLLGMMPGMGQMRDQLNKIDDRDLDRIAAIIRSMTPAERRDPKIINGSRRERIAAAPG